MRKIITDFSVACFALMVSGTAASAACSWTTLTNGTTASATQVMNNFDCLAPMAEPRFTGKLGLNVASPAYTFQANTGTNQNLVIRGTINMSNGIVVQSLNDAYSAHRKMEFIASQYSFNDGNVDIGVASASSKLQINAGANQNLAVMGTTNMSNGVTIQSLNDAFGAHQKLELIASQFAFTSGNVGIGITNPLAKLHVSNGGNEGMEFYPGSGGGIDVLQFYDRSASTYEVARVIAASYRFETAGTERMRLDSSGNLGVGTASPGQKLDASGNIRQTGCTTAGTLSANTSGDIICTSDARLKNIRGAYTDGLDVLMRITPQRFTYKPTKSNPIETFEHVGFIAQNIRAAIPQASARQRDGYYSLDTTAILAASVNAIKELQAINARQADEITKLKASNSRLVAADREREREIGSLRADFNELRNVIGVRKTASAAASGNVGI